MESTVRERIKEVLCEKNKSISSVAGGSGTALQRKMSRQINEGAKVTMDVISVLLKTFPDISERWLVDGEGEKYKVNESIYYQSTIDNTVSPNVYEGQLAECGNLGGICEAITKSSMTKTIIMPEAPEGVVYIRAHGDSMVSNNSALSIPHGAYVALKKKESSYIQWGEVYAVATRDGIVIKRVLPAENDGDIKCVSNNPQFPPFNISKGEILDMALVVGVISCVFKPC